VHASARPKAKDRVSCTEESGVAGHLCSEHCAVPFARYLQHVLAGRCGDTAHVMRSHICRKGVTCPVMHVITFTAKFSNSLKLTCSKGAQKNVGDALLEQRDDLKAEQPSIIVSQVRVENF
jgi:hypothetical protein